MDVEAVEVVHVKVVIFTANCGTELIDEPVPVGGDHAHPRVAFQRQLQAEQAVEELLVPPDKAGIQRRACRIVAHLGHVHPAHCPPGSRSSLNEKNVTVNVTVAT